MDTLATLIKLNRFTLDEQRRRVADIESRRATLDQQLTACDAQLAQEREAAACDPQGAAMFPAFMTRWRTGRQALSTALGEVDAELAAARDVLAGAFRELKQYELASDTRAETARVEEAKRQQGMLDEISLNIFRQGAGTE